MVKSVELLQGTRLDTAAAFAKAERDQRDRGCYLGAKVLYGSRMGQDGALELARSSRPPCAMSTCYVPLVPRSGQSNPRWKRSMGSA
ncbi:hypothetical protein ACFQX4_26780 [Roseomonas sp. GCM10028921]